MDDEKTFVSVLKNDGSMPSGMTRKQVEKMISDTVKNDPEASRILKSIENLNHSASINA